MLQLLKLKAFAVDKRNVTQAFSFRVFEIQGYLVKSYTNLHVKLEQRNNHLKTFFFPKITSLENSIQAMYLYCHNFFSLKFTSLVFFINRSIQACFEIMLTAVLFYEVSSSWTKTCNNHEQYRHHRAEKHQYIQRYIC